MKDLPTLVREGRPPREIAAYLDGLDGDARQAQLAALDRAQLAALYRLVAGQHVELDHFVPAHVPAGVPVRHVGLNSMPLFRTVDKRFVRSPDDPAELWGYNHLENPVAAAFSGPGCFTVRSRPAVAPDGRSDDQLFIDYWRVPPRQPHPSWPAVRDNESLPARLVYGRMCDTMWRVSDHVSIGEAFRAGRAIGAFFVIARRDA